MSVKDIQISQCYYSIEILTVHFLRLVCVEQPVRQRDVLVDDAAEVLATVDVVGADGDAKGQALGVLLPSAQ